MSFKNLKMKKPIPKFYFKNLLRITQNLKNWKNICDALHDLVPFVQLKKREKHPWKA